MLINLKLLCRMQEHLSVRRCPSPLRSWTFWPKSWGHAWKKLALTTMPESKPKRSASLSFSSSSCYSLIITRTVWPAWRIDLSFPVAAKGQRAWSSGGFPLTSESSACCSGDMSSGGFPLASESSSACCSGDMYAGGLH